jgi:RNA polymerase sigma-70 factor, ECF subfamily
LNNNELEIEAKIVVSARNGNIDSFGWLYKHYYTTIVWLAYSILLDRDQAEDAAQETFVLVCKKIARLRQTDKFAPWLASICRNVAYQMLRKRKKEILTNDPPDIPEPSYDDSREKAVKDAIVRLPNNYRELVILKYYNDMSYEQIESVSGLSIDKVKGRLFRARKKIGKYLTSKNLI